MKRAWVLAAVAALGVAPARAQVQPGWARFSLFAETSRRSFDDGAASSFNELIAIVSIRSGSSDGEGFEYAVDARAAGFDGAGNATRVSMYNAYVGRRFASGRLAVRLGQMWLTELGGIGSVGGVAAEYRGPRSAAGLRFRAGLFAGKEPKLYDAGYVQGVEKGGGYLALDAPHGRRHVLGFVTVRNRGITERSVLTTTNFVPVSGGTFFLYQAAEYDLERPGGVGRGGLTYVMANARWAPVRLVELQGLYHRGRSVDARTITNNELDGRPIDPRLAQGYLFESAGVRITVRPARWLRVWGGLARDRNNNDEKTHGRVTAGFSLSDIAGSGLDLTALTNRIDRSTGSYDAWYASVGRSFGRRVYVSVDYNSSLSIVRFTGSDGVTVESRPTSRRWGLSSNITLSRTFTLLLTGERLEDAGSEETRLVTGLTVRF